MHSSSHIITVSLLLKLYCHRGFKYTIPHCHLRSPCYTLGPQNLRISQLKFFNPCQFAPFLSPLSPWQPLLYAVAMSCMFLGSTYKWDITVCIFLWLMSLSIMPSCSIYVVRNIRIFFFSMANIPLCILKWDIL